MSLHYSHAAAVDVLAVAFTFILWHVIHMFNAILFSFIKTIYLLVISPHAIVSRALHLPMITTSLLVYAYCSHLILIQR